MSEYAWKFGDEWVGPYPSRDDAAIACVKAERAGGAHTSPILARRNGRIIVDRNSIVHFLARSEEGGGIVIEHSRNMMREARIK